MVRFMRMTKLAVMLLSLIGLGNFLFVNCARSYNITDQAVVDGSGNGDPSTDANGESTSSQTDPASDDNRGVKGGHFDLDTAHSVSDFNKGTKDYHVHEYDNKFDVTNVDYFNMRDSKFTKITSQVQPNQEFYIIIGNSELSPGAQIKINGKMVDLNAYRKQFENFLAGTEALPTFSLDGSVGTKLTTFEINFDVDAIIHGDLIPTLPKCVFDNKPGPKGEYRNGALVVQIIDKQKAQFNLSTKTAAVDGGLLWESMVYWHKPDANCL